MPRLLALLALLFLAAPAFAQAPPPLQTAAEASNFTTTTLHSDVVAFCERLAKENPAVVRHVTYGRSHQGKPLPLLILGDAKKPTLFVYANIHAGEIDGKEAVLALARDMVADKESTILKHFGLLIAPDINPDGNDVLSVQHRPEQNGPHAVGTRANAQGFDLNRDFVKLESPEIRAIVALMNEHDPRLIIDCHTTNGSKHRYPLTYDGPRNPAADERLVAFAETLYPAVAEKLKKATGFDSFLYGNFSDDKKQWETYGGGPRFGTQYVALRGRPALLSESYAYATYKDRVTASYHYVKANLEYAVEKRSDFEKLATECDKPRPRIALRTRTVPFDKDLTVLGYEETTRDGKRIETDTPKDYTCGIVGKMVATMEVERPAAYLIPPYCEAAVHTLRRHGIEVSETREEMKNLPVEAYTVVGQERAAPPFQQHALLKLEVTKAKVVRAIPAGWFLVKTTQKLGNLACYLLEPQAEDGLATWNAFDASLVNGGEYPVLRLPAEASIAAGAPRPLPEDRKTNLPITERLANGAGFAGTPMSPPEWLADGEHYLQTKGGVSMMVHARTGRAEPFLDAAKMTESLKAVQGLRRPDLAGLSRGLGLRMDPPRTGTLVDAGGHLWFAKFDGTPAVKVTTSSGPREFVTFSPTGKHLAFVRAGNLFAVDIEKKTERQLTTDGGGEILNGRGDWVYEEEIFNRNGQAYWWSPDGTAVAFLRFDDAPVKKFTLADAYPARGRAEVYAYPKPGDPNPTVTIGVVDVTEGKPTFLDLGKQPAKDSLVARVGWMPGTRKVYAYLQNRVQTWLDFTVWESPASAPTVLFRDKTQAWIDDPGEPHFLANGSFLFLSERSGWKQLYHYAADGKPIIPPVTQPAHPRTALTKADWQVRDILRIDEKEGAVYVTGTRHGSTTLNLYRVSLNGGTDRITIGDGTHTVALAPAGDLFVDRFTDSSTPSRATLRTLAGEAVRVLDTNPAYSREEYRFGRYERVKIPLADGFVLEGAVTYPPDFDPTRQYPVWVATYAGPHTPTVRDAWGNGHAAEQMLAGMGIIAFNVDPRSASAKSASASWTCYHKLGVQELKDLEGAVAWLAKNPWVDAARVGLSGHSFGGYITAYALTHSKTFSAGIAGAPVTDWRLYDSIYTERYMGLPSENEAGYDETSCITAAANLHGRLLILHGLVDDNVHIQNTMQFADALQKANKPFEMMVYPRSRHGIRGAHYDAIKLDFIKRTMLGTAGPDRR